MSRRKGAKPWTAYLLRERDILFAGQVDTWVRTCTCESDCSCWEFAKRRAATPADEAQFAEAQIPMSSRQDTSESTADRVRALWDKYLSGRSFVTRPYEGGAE